MPNAAAVGGEVGKGGLGILLERHRQGMQISVNGEARVSDLLLGNLPFVIAEDQAA